MISRRLFLLGAASAIAAPAIVRPGILMPIKVIDLPSPLYPGELLLPHRDLKFWVEELDIRELGFRALRVVAHDDVGADHLHHQRTLAAFSEL